MTDGLPATESGLVQPLALEIDASGDLWIGDAGALRRISASTGILTSGPRFSFLCGLSRGLNGTFLASDGSFDHSGVYRFDPSSSLLVRLAGGEDGDVGDGRSATSAILAGPYDVSPAPDGGLLVPEFSGLRIRKFFPGGLISTVAGNGHSAGAAINVPATSGVVIQSTSAVADPAGNIYYDTGNVVVRADASSGLVTLFAGGGSAQPGDGGSATEARLVSARALAIDGRGGLLIADDADHRVRRVDLSTRVITTVAGTGVAGFSGDGGPASSAQLKTPRDVAVDAAGNIYVADSGNGRIRKVRVSDGTISTVAGGGTTSVAGPVDALAADIWGPEALAVDAAGNLVFSYQNSYAVARLDAATRRVAPFGRPGETRASSGDGGPASDASFFGLVGLCFDRSGNLFVADVMSNRIRAVFACVTVSPPSLSAPADGAAGTSTGPTLSWSAVAGAFRYDVYLGTTSPPTTAVATDLAATSFTPVNLQPGTKYYWKVVAKGDPFCVPFSSAGSAVRSFTTAAGCAAPGAPVLSAPADGAKVPAASATLSWAASSGAGTYDVYFGATNPPPLAASGLSSTSWTPSGLTGGGLYYWSVLARVACDPSKSASSGVRSFQVDGVGCFPPGAFSLSTPADGATDLPADLTVAWSASAGATSYDFYLGHSSPPPLYLSGLTSTALALRSLSPGATYRWKVVARTSCDAAASTSTAIRSFTVRGTCNTPGATSFTFLPPGAVGSGRSYVVAWNAAADLGAGGGYVVERSTSPSFSPPLDTVTTSTLFASFIAPAPGSVYHRVRAVPACDPAKAGPWSPNGLVSVTSATPNVVFSRAPEAMVLALGDRLEDRKSVFTLENVTSGPIQVFLGRQELSSPPFFTVTDPSGGDAGILTLEPHVPKVLEVRFSGPRSDVAGAYQGVVFAASVGAGLAVTPWAYVSLKVGSSPDAVPQFRLNGVATEYAAFPGLSGPDDGRAPLSVDVRNPGSFPLELAAEVGPELWLALEPGWNSAPIPPGGSRTLRLSTRRIRAPNGSALPRYTYLTLRTKGGVTSRLLVQDNEAPLLSSGRGASAVRPEASFLVPSVAHVTSALGNTFVSRVSLSNAGTEVVQAELVFTPASSDAALVDGFGPAVRRATVLVPPNDVVRLSDPLVMLFGLTPPVSGTLEVRAPAERAGFLSVASSVDAPASGGGAFGFALPVFRSGEGIRAGASAAITAVASDAAERTNLILAETTGVDEARVRVSFYDASGSLRGSESLTVPRWGQRQLSAVVQRLGGATGSRAGRIEVAVESGGGTLAAVTTVVDNANDDAAAFAARGLDSSASSSRSLRALRPAWALATGTVKSLVPALVNGYQTFPASAEPFTFRSVLGFSNLASSEALFRLTYYDLASGTTIAREVRVPGRRSVEYSNALEQLFGIGAGAKSQGPLFVESDPSGLLWCRVASSLVNGTIGDSFPVIPVPSEGLTSGADARLLALDGLEQSVDRSRGTRSNLLLNEVAGKAVSLLVSLYEAGNRACPIATRELSLKPLEKLQLSTVFSELGLESEARRKDRTGVLCTVKALSGDGLASAVVTTIDNRTGDTRNTHLLPNGSGAAGGSIGF